MTTKISTMASSMAKVVVLVVTTIFTVLFIVTPTISNTVIKAGNNIPSSIVSTLTTKPLLFNKELGSQQQNIVGTQTRQKLSTTSPTTITPPSVTVKTKCMHMNNVLWNYQKDATTLLTVKAIFALFYSLIIIFGVVGNLCVILSISRTRCSDIVVCCTSATITPITAFQKEWLFGQFLCSVAPFIAGVSLCFSTFTLAAISLDRFMLIRFPLKKPFSHAQAFFIIFLICILAMGLSMPIMFMQKLRPIEKYCGQFCYEDWGANQSQRRAYGTVMLALQFIIPLFVIIFCYTAISVRLGQSVILKSKNGLTYHWQLQMTDQQRAATKRRQRTNRMFIAMVVAFSVSWIWTLLFNLFRDYEILPKFVKRQEFFCGILTHCIAMTSTVWNPLLYALLNLQLRAAFIQLMPVCLKKTLVKRRNSKTIEIIKRSLKNQSAVKDQSLVVANNTKIFRGNIIAKIAAEIQSTNETTKKNSNINHNFAIKQQQLSSTNSEEDDFLRRLGGESELPIYEKEIMDKNNELHYLQSLTDEHLNLDLESTDALRLTSKTEKLQKDDFQNSEYSLTIQKFKVLDYDCNYSMNFSNVNNIELSCCNHNTNAENNTMPNKEATPKLHTITTDNKILMSPLDN